MKDWTNTKERSKSGECKDHHMSMQQLLDRFIIDR